ncbi:type II toxin-antitoxin system Phd/YefM family antitoxin [Persicirhabdus sediminis]|uniref:Antitoxin n=1 Tax=Persicirhabdus sediminis TaxID=454144 RepID=A0A8J7SLN1_9BACT|nr:type II toxin-antitoxin system prevent-host-death family antitoxin [Persicirhabdus sediminis]MBK1791485.1 type II toxin-antitoxin system prevent-host-death family antitoxin [Persicirhabdus sediminis]
MNTILSHYSASISELKKNPSRLIEDSGGETIAILNHNKPTAYLVPAERYEEICELLDDVNIAKIIDQRKAEKFGATSLALDEL